jgi:hypothetical protein
MGDWSSGCVSWSSHWCLDRVAVDTMIDVKQNRDLIVVYCDRCASKLHFYASSLKEDITDAIRGCGWQVVTAKKHRCRGCIRKEQGKGRRD